MAALPFDVIYRDFDIEGMPASGVHHPLKKDIRDSHNAQIAGPFPDNRVIRLNNANEGTPNNIIVSAAVAIPAAVYQVLYILNVTQENTGPVTVSGAINRALVTNTSEPFPTGYFKPGMAVLCIDTGTTLRMLSYGDMETIVRDAEAALAEAVTARDQARDAANDAVSQGNVPIYSTKAAVEGYEIPAGIHAIRINGWDSFFDGQGGLFVDEDNGSAITVLSGDDRTWYKAEDISPSRLKSGQEVAFQKKLKLRERLWADRNYYVRPDGYDGNDGLSNAANRAFKTINRARQEVYSAIDLNGFTAYVNIYNGTYFETVYCVGEPVGQGSNPTPIVFRGMGASRDDVNVPGGFQALSGSRIHISQMRLDPAGANNYCMFAKGVGSFITGANINFGQCGTPGASVTDHMMATDGAGLEMTGPYAIHGGALNHYHCTEGAFMRIAGQSVPVLNTPAFNGQFAGVASSSLFVIGVSYDGGATGRTYLVHYNGVIRANLDTRNVFPGNIHGVERSGGRLDAASMFSAHKNGANQVVANGNWVKLTMPALQFTFGGDYDVPNNRWNPRAGEVEISATVTLSSVAGPDQILGVSIFKSGVEFKSALLNSSGANGVARSISVTARDTTDGSAYYELFVRGGDTGSATVAGNPAWTHWSGRQY